MKLIINILFLLALFPEASFIPVSTNDTQPLFPLLSLIYLIFKTLTLKFKFDQIAKYLLIFSISSILFVNYSYFELGKYTSIFLPIFSFSIYFFGLNNKEKLDHRTVFIVIQIYLWVSLVQQFFPSLYVQLFTKFLSTYRWEIGGGSRGNNSLCVEPSHVAIIGVVLYLISKILLKEHSNNRIYWINTISLVVLEYLTKSVYSYLFFLIVLIDNFQLVLKKPKLAAIPLIFLVFILYSALSNTNSRSGQFFQFIIENPTNLFGDQSFAMRINGILYGLYSIFHYPFGLFRLEYVPDVLNAYKQNYLFNILFPSPIHIAIINYTSSSFSGIGSYFIRMGVFFLLLIILISSQIYRNNKIFVIVFLFYLMNLSIISAPIWIMIAIVGSKTKIEQI